MTLMLQKRPLLLAASALAAAAFAAPALAGASPQPCALSEGQLPTGALAYISAAEACLATPPEGLSLDADLSADVLTELNLRRAEKGLIPLRERAGLSRAAALHAFELAVSQTDTHRDGLGRGHADRIAALDRTVLVSISGENIALVPTAFASDPVALISARLASSENSVENMMRSGFTDVGIAVVKADGLYYVVQVFASVEGELETPIPASLATRALLSVAFEDPAVRMTGIRLNDASGKTLAIQKSRRLSPQATDSELAYVKIAAQKDGQARLFRGPMVGFDQ
jgi:uncharacterized protein YkwD